MNEELRESNSLRRLILGYRLSQAISVAAKLGIADLLANGALSTSELSRATGANSDALFRLLRLLAGEGVFEEIEPRSFRLTRRASYLRTDILGSLRERAIFDCEHFNWSSWGNLDEGVLQGRSAVSLTHGVELFQFLKQHSDVDARFNALMAEQTAASAEAISTSYDFGTASIIVDVGGGFGALLTAILRKYSKARGVLFDVPHVIQEAQNRLTQDVRERCDFVGGNFFDSIPTKADIYVLKYILHDWSDSECQQILQNCRRAVRDDSRLLLVEVIIPPGNNPDYAKYLDLNMLVLTRGRERTEAEYRFLVQSSGFELLKIIDTPSDLKLVECRPTARGST